MKTIAALILAGLLAACGGGDDSPISAANYSQTAPAGSLTTGALPEASVTIIALEHNVGNKLSRLTITASVSNARSTGAPTAAGTRWVIRENGSAIAQGPLSTAPAGGSSGNTTHEVTVSGGRQVTVEITGHVTGPGAAIQWDAATLALDSKPL